MCLCTASQLQSLMANYSGHTTTRYCFRCLSCHVPILSSALSSLYDENAVSLLLLLLLLLFSTAVAIAVDIAVSVSLRLGAFIAW